MSEQMTKSWRRQVRIGGEAGQGVILAGVMLAEVAAEDGREVAQSARYGAAVRGGDATADVVMADGPIDYPHVEEPDILITLSQPTYDQYAPKQKAGTVLLYDPFFVVPKKCEGVRQLAIPATDAAIREFGKGTGANIVILGALAALTGVVTTKSLQKVIGKNPKRRFRENNLGAIDIGAHLAGQAKEATS